MIHFGDDIKSLESDSCNATTIFMNLVSKDEHDLKKRQKMTGPEMPKK